MIKISPNTQNNIHGIISGIELYVSAIRKEVSKEYVSPQYIKEKSDAIESNLTSIEGYMEYETDNQ